MSVGQLIAIIVLIICVVGLVFSAAMPAWLPLALIGGLAIALLLHGWPVFTRPA